MPWRPPRVRHVSRQATFPSSWSLFSRRPMLIVLRPKSQLLASYGCSLGSSRVRVASWMYVYLGYGHCFRHLPWLWDYLMTDSLVRPSVAHENWSRYFRGKSCPRYTPSIRCDCPPGVLAAYLVESFLGKDRNSKLHVCLHGDMIRFRPWRLAAAMEAHMSPAARRCISAGGSDGEVWRRVVSVGCSGKRP